MNPPITPSLCRFNPHDVKVVRQSSQNLMPRHDRSYPSIGHQGQHANVGQAGFCYTRMRDRPPCFDQSFEHHPSVRILILVCTPLLQANLSIATRICARSIYGSPFLHPGQPNRYRSILPKTSPTRLKIGYEESSIPAAAGERSTHMGRKELPYKRQAARCHRPMRLH